MSRSSRELNASIEGSVRDLVIVLGDQLDSNSPLIREMDRDEDAVLMMETDEEATHVPSHRQRTVLFLSAMRHFALDLLAKKTRVRYRRIDVGDRPASFSDEVERAIEALSPSRVRLLQPGERRVESMVEEWRKLDVEVDVVEDPHFTASIDRFRQWRKGRKQLTMEYFYREQRKRLDILMSKGKPIGGEWNYDSKNRETFKKTPSPPTPRRFRPDAITKEVMESVDRIFPDAPGRLDHFPWPVTRSESKKALNDFIEKRLPRFGSYQDAMWTDQPWLYHSLLSSSLNLKLLTVEECVEPAVEAYDSEKAPINAVEGFVRQLIGWREYIRGVYWTEGSDYRDGNSLDHRGSLPEFYWSGETEMACLSDAVGQVLEYGYGHHIQRLMVTGNFALIAGISPQAVNDWYLGMYVDAVDWVTTPNVIGMTLHADGGVVGTKPYAASGRYISRMSNYCKGCRFDPTKRTGDDACPFTTFYWDFLLAHETRFKKNHRMRMILKNLDSMDRSEKKEIRSTAAKRRKEFGID